jgi:hypothetical protein
VEGGSNMNLDPLVREGGRVGLEGQILLKQIEILVCLQSLKLSKLVARFVVEWNFLRGR